MIERDVLICYFSQQATSMAELQGFFLKYKDDPAAAIDNVLQINASVVHKPHERQDEPPTRENKDTDEVEENSRSVSEQANRPPTPRRSRHVTAFELDKMAFNPQYDWEKDIYTGPKS